MKRSIALGLLVFLAVALGAAALETLTVCSFNIHELGAHEEKEIRALALVVAGHDLVVIQGIVAPPYAGTYPNGDPMLPDPLVAAFFDEMVERWGYAYLLSSEDTGRRLLHHTNEPWTEWFAVFYDPAVLEPAEGLPSGFLADDVTAHPVFDRVPFAFGLRHLDTGFDFTLIPVHLHEGAGEANRARRAAELEAIAAWIADPAAEETEYLVVGSLQFADCGEIVENTPAMLQFLNPTTQGECLATDASLTPNRPYDGVLFTRRVDVDYVFGLQVIDLVHGLAAVWNPYAVPLESAYAELGFVDRISDHHPIVFRFRLASGDWD